MPHLSCHKQKQNKAPKHPFPMQLRGKKDFSDSGSSFPLICRTYLKANGEKQVAHPHLLLLVAQKREHAFKEEPSTNQESLDALSFLTPGSLLMLFFF